MLEQLRKNASGLVAKILIGLLVISFAVWGIADIFSPSIDTTVAEVGDEEISGELFLFEYRRDLRQRSQDLNRQITLNEGQALGFDKQVLDQMVGRTVLDVTAREMGLGASQELVIEDIRNDPAFAGPTGQFDRETFQQVLFANGISEAFLIDDRERFIRRQQLINAIGAGVAAPQGLAERMFSVLNERRIAEYMVLTPEVVDMPADPDDETVQKFYEARAAGLYQEPEYRAFSFLRLTPEMVAETIEISEEVLREEYEARKAEFDKPERRVIEQISFDTREAAEEARASLSEGKTFAAIADDKGLEPEEYKLGTLERRQMFSDDLAEVAFSIDEGTVSEPVEGPVGWLLIHVPQVIPAVDSTFEDARERLRDELATDRAYNELYDYANQVEDARAGGATLAEAGAVLGLEPTPVPPVTSRGLARNGQRPAVLPADGRLVVEAFQVEPGDEAPMVETDDGAFFWVDVTEVIEARTPPLDEVRAQVVETWKEEEREAALLRLAADLAARINGTESFAEVADDYDRAPLETQPLTRDMSNETFSRIAINNLFSVGEGEATYGPVGFGSSVVVMQAKEVVPGDAEEAGETFEDFEARLDGAFADDVTVQFLNALRARVGVDVNQSAVNYVIGGGDDGRGAGGV